MRRVIELLLLLLVCGAGCFLLDRYITSRPTLLSGTVVDWTTGRPVPDVEVRFKEINWSTLTTRMDPNGRFTVVVPEDKRILLLYAEGPQFGSLLQASFGRAVLIWRRGERHSGIIVPAIPSTEVSGHVYDGGTNPLAGCAVSVWTEDPGVDPRFYAVDFAQTDRAGAFSFTHLGADRYLLEVRCHRYLAGEEQGYNGVGSVPWRVRDSWPLETKPIVLKPGDRRQGIEFHLSSEPQYSVHGKVIFSNGIKPLRGAIYFHEMSATSLPPRLESEPCSWDAASDDFHCDFLSPGAYKLTFGMDGWPDSKIGVQKAEVVVEVKAQKQPQPELMVQLKKWDSAPKLKESLAETGFLHLKRVCEAGMREPWIWVRTWGATREPSIPRLQYLGCGSEKTWPVAAGEYVVGASQLGPFAVRPNSKVDALVRQHGSSVTIIKGRTSELSLQALSTDEIIRLALRSLRGS